MLDHNPKHQSEMLTSKQLKPFFADLENRYKGKTIYIYPASHLEHTQGDADPETLVSFNLDHHRRKDMLTIHTTNKGNPQETTIVANLVWMIRDPEGKVVTLEVNDEQNKKLVVEFEQNRN